MSVYITSDIHFDHVKIVTFTDRPYNDVGAMNEDFVSIFNSVLTDDDTLIVVGDAVMGHREESLKHFGRIKGRKLLWPGNHDYVHPMHSQAMRDKWTPVYERYFTIIDPTTNELVVFDEIGMFAINHFPYAGDHAENRYDAAEIDEYRPTDRGLWLLHGHVHSTAAHWGPRQIHVGIDADYTAFGVERYHPIPVEVLAQVRDSADEHSN